MTETIMKNIMFRQAQFWLSLLVAVLLTLKLRDIGSINAQSSGTILLLTFALTTYHVSISTGWIFKLRGFLLTLSVVFVVWVEQYIWLLS